MGNDHARAASHPAQCAQVFSDRAWRGDRGRCGDRHGDRWAGLGRSGDGGCRKAWDQYRYGNARPGRHGRRAWRHGKRPIHPEGQRPARRPDGHCRDRGAHRCDARARRLWKREPQDGHRRDGQPLSGRSELGGRARSHLRACRASVWPGRLRSWGNRAEGALWYVRSRGADHPDQIRVLRSNRVAAIERGVDLWQRSG